MADTVYNALGRVKERWLGSGGVVRQKYTFLPGENYRLTTLRSGTAAGGYQDRQNITYDYNAAGNLLTISDAAAYGGSQTQSFSYDALNRLVTAQATGGSYGAYSQQGYTYSSAGNITSFEGATFAYNDVAHKHAVTHVGGVQRYWYDENGNATRRITPWGWTSR